MTFPTVQATNTSADAAATTSHVVSLPASIAAGDLLIIFLGTSATIAPCTATGWTFFSEDLNAGNAALNVGYRTADGTEGATVTVTSTASKLAVHTSYRISGWSGTPERDTATTGSGTSADPPNLTPSWGALDTLWLAACSVKNITAPTGAPTSYSNLKTIGGTGTSIGTAQRQLNAASENPGAFTNSNAAWLAQTYAIKPVAAVVNTQTVTVTCTSSVSLAKQAGKSIAATCASTVSLLRSALKKVAVTCASTVSVSRNLGKIIAVGCVSTASTLKSISKLIAPTSASITTISEQKFKISLVTVACASAVTMLRDMVKTIAVGCASTVSLLRSLIKTIAVGCASTVSLITNTTFGLVITVVCSGAVSMFRLILKDIEIACLSLVLVTLSSVKVITFSCVSAMSVLKTALKPISVTCVSLIAMLRSLAKNVEIGCTAAVSMAKRVSRSMAVACVSLVTLIIQKSVSQKITVGCATAVTKFKSVLKNISVTSVTTTLRGTFVIGKIVLVNCVSLTSPWSHALVRTISVGCTGTVSIVKASTLTFTLGCITSAGVVLQGLKLIVAACSSLLSMGRAVVKNIAPRPTGTVSVIKASTRTFGLTSVSLTLATKQTLLFPFRVFSETSTSMFRQAQHPMSIGIATSTQVLKRVTRTFATSVTTSVSAARTVLRSLFLTAVSTATMTRRAAHAFRVECYTTAVALKQVARTLAVTCVSATSLLAGKIRHATLTVTPVASSVAMSRTVGKSVLVTVTSLVSTVRKIYLTSKRFVVALFERRVVVVPVEVRSVGITELRLVRAVPVDGANLMLQWPSKDPDEILDYDVDWSGRINDGDYITACTFLVQQIGGTLLISSTSFSAPSGRSKVILTGGTLGVKYTVLCTIDTFSGDHMEQTVALDMVAK